MLIRIAVRAPFLMIASFFMIFITNKTLGLIVLAVVIILAFVLAFIMSKSHPLFLKMFKKYDRLNEDIQENINGIRAVKSFVREDYENERFDKASEDIYVINKAAEKLIVLNQPCMMFAIYTTILLICWFGAHFVVSGSLQVGQLMSLFSYIMSALMGLNMLSMIMVMLVMSIASAQRIVQVITQVSYLESPKDGVKEVKNGEVVFDKTCFNYAGDLNDPLVLDDINLTIESGSTLGILGATGSAKSTLVQLIPRLYDATTGSVKVAGVDVKDYDLKTLRDNVAMVLQKNVLFSGTIIENMRWGDPDATLEEIEEACTLAQADEFIQRMPDKYNTYIEQGGTNVSGGQRQRLCIARALLKKPKILILDDSTSAVDTHTDALIREAFLKKIPDTTRIIISQRISSIQDADKIVVLDNGKISAIGSHEELLKNSDIYSQTFEQQQKGGDFDEQ
jgi:ATP-binding cassette subfamily B protein